ncbi:MAG: hypothetical protein IT377_10095 [Polyangiaceae bacterium]|nr:hypothetical protein [Polyangiaceae bacterium]
MRTTPCAAWRTRGATASSVAAGGGSCGSALVAQDLGEAVARVRAALGGG